MLGFDHVANQAATLDVVSAGRLILGVGTGWNPEEFEAVGVSARERGARTDDHLAAARAMWARRPADFDGPSDAVGVNSRPRRMMPVA